MLKSKMETKKKLDISLIFFMAVATVICIESFKLGIGTLRAPQAGFLPFLLGVALGLLATARLLINLSSPGALEWVRISISTKRVVSVLVALFAYVFLLDVLGFFLDTFLLIFFLIRGVESKPWWVAGLGGLGISFFCYLVFRVWLRVQLPSGFLDF
jgi:putative tricarboxylic transport membrane protein